MKTIPTDILRKGRYKSAEDIIKKYFVTSDILNRGTSLLSLTGETCFDLCGFNKVTLENKNVLGSFPLYSIVYYMHESYVSLILCQPIPFYGVKLIQ